MEKPIMIRLPSVSGYGGAHDRMVLDGNGGGTVEWQPGDGTRYILMARVVSEDEARMIGCGPGDLMVTVSANGGWVSLPLVFGCIHHISYLGEKLAPYGITTQGRLDPLVALINMVVGDEEYGREIFAAMMADRCGVAER